MSYIQTLGATTDSEKPQPKLAGAAGAIFVWIIPLALYALLKRKMKASGR
jgi:hypothetical protein